MTWHLDFHDTLRRTAERLETAYIAILGFTTGFTLLFSAGLMVAIGGGRSHLPGRLAVAVAAVLLLGWIDTHASKLARRRRPVLGPDPQWYRRFVVWSALAWFGSAAVLFAIAWYLP